MGSGGEQLGERDAFAPAWGRGLKHRVGANLVFAPPVRPRAEDGPSLFAVARGTR